MEFNENIQNIKVTDASFEDNISPPKSKGFRFITSKWLSGKEDTKTPYESKEDLSIESNIESYPSKDKITKEKLGSLSVIQLNPDTDFDISVTNVSSDLGSNTETNPSPEKGKRKKAFSTIRYYLERNKSHDSIDISTEPESNSDLLNPNTVSSSLNPLTSFDKDLRNNNSLDSMNINQNLTINTLDTKLDGPKKLFAIFDDDKKNSIINKSKSNKESGSISDSEISSDDITISKTKTAQLNNIKDNSISSDILKPRNINNQVKMVSLFVGDLDPSVTENDLYLYFSKFKGLISVKIPMDTIKNVSLQYGYVNFDNQKNADLATEGLNYSELMGSEIRIMPSLRDKTQRENLGANLFFSNLSPSLTSRIMYDRFKVFGKILSCKFNEEKCFCFINFAEKSDAYKICERFNQTEMDGKTINVSVHISKKDRESFQNNKKLHQTINEKLSPTSVVNSPVLKNNWTSSLNSAEKHVSTKHSIFMKNLPMDLNDNVIRNLVEPYGTVKNVLTRKVPSKNGLWALVTMTNQAAVDRTIQNLNSVEIEGKQLFVTKAIPREEKDYAKRESNPPQKRVKLLISEINLEKDKNFLKEWCSDCEAIKSAEFFSNSPKGETPVNKKSSGYGYIELNDDNDADSVIEKLKQINIVCYKIKIEVSDDDKANESYRYPYVMNRPIIDNTSTFKFKPNAVSFSYVDPSKLFQIANFQNDVNSDKMTYFQKLENHNKTKLKERNKLDEKSLELLSMKQNEMYHVMWEICARLLLPNPTWNNNLVKYPIISEPLSRSRISSLTDHLVKFFWNNNFDQFYNFIKENQFDEQDRIIYTANSVLANQILQSANYLGIIPK